MTSTHIDMLAKWWENAEHAPFRKCDMLISRSEGEPVTYEVYPAGCDHNVPADNVRVLHRAPKPTPAWHDAVAVIAKGQDEWDRREAFTRSDDYPETRWVCNQGVTFKSEDLFDVTPLIEQKVTDEMVGRIRELEDGYGRKYFASPLAARELLTAALGLDPA